MSKQHDPVNHPKHYTSHPSGVECIQITEHFGFNVGNAVKYLWRAGLKGDAIEDLRKAAFYVNREIEKRQTEAYFAAIETGRAEPCQGDCGTFDCTKERCASAGQ